MVGVVPSVSAQSPPSCPTNFIGEKVSPSPSEAIRQLDLEKWKAVAVPESADVKIVLRSAETFQWNWLQDKKGRRQGVRTIRHGNEDVLLSRWEPQTNDRQIKNIQMWDGALYELVIFEIDPTLAASADSL